MRLLEDNSIDACVTDPPYHLGITQRGGAPQFKRLARGFMGQTWDGGGIAFEPDTWKQVYRVLKPGGHLLSMGGTRTFHRMACAVEDAGFEIRDCLFWLYGTGFPKTFNVGEQIDKQKGLKRRVIGSKPSGLTKGRSAGGQPTTVRMSGSTLTVVPITAPASKEAEQWEGWATSLRPAAEPIVMARKPYERTVASNVLKHGVGALNVAACRIGDTPRHNPSASNSPDTMFHTLNGGEREGRMTFGRWPANVLLAEDPEVLDLFPEGESVYFSRFHYSGKADAVDRIASGHPTVKPLSLMRWLVRLVTPRGGLVLDLFAGTGTTGEAAFKEGADAVLIERVPAYQQDIRNRLTLAARDHERDVAINLAADPERDNAFPIYKETTDGAEPPASAQQVRSRQSGTRDQGHRAGANPLPVSRGQAGGAQRKHRDKHSADDSVQGSNPRRRSTNGGNDRRVR
jgi:site-specific DNA-methyltransferase (adenine-specific)